ncbi:MAG TPA: glycosyltransferase family 4 protein, partial [bacterium]|nr:glycosyltransferase family 4 protein [bacterium]
SFNRILNNENLSPWAREFRQKLFIYRLNLIYDNARAVIAVSQFIADELTGALAVDPAKVRVIYNGSDFNLSSVGGLSGLSSGSREGAEQTRRAEVRNDAVPREKAASKLTGEDQKSVFNRLHVGEWLSRIRQAFPSVTQSEKDILSSMAYLLYPGAGTDIDFAVEDPVDKVVMVDERTDGEFILSDIVDKLLLWKDRGVSIQSISPDFDNQSFRIKLETSNGVKQIEYYFGTDIYQDFELGDRPVFVKYRGFGLITGLRQGNSNAKFLSRLPVNSLVSAIHPPDILNGMEVLGFREVQLTGGFYSGVPIFRKDYALDENELIALHEALYKANQIDIEVSWDPNLDLAAIERRLLSVIRRRSEVRSSAISENAIGSPENRAINSKDYPDLYEGIRALYERQAVAGHPENGEWKGFFRIVDDGNLVRYGLFLPDQPLPQMYSGGLPEELLRQAELIAIENPGRSLRPGQVTANPVRMKANDRGAMNLVPGIIEKEFPDQYWLEWEGLRGPKWWALYNPFPIYPPKEGAPVDEQPHHLTLTRGDRRVYQSQIYREDYLRDILSFWIDLNKSPSLQDQKKFRLGINGWYASRKKKAPKGGASQSQIHAQLVRFTFPIERAEIDQKRAIGPVLISTLSDDRGTGIVFEATSEKKNILVHLAARSIKAIIEKGNSFNVIGVFGEDGRIKVFVIDRVLTTAPPFTNELGYSEIGRAFVGGIGLANGTFREDAIAALKKVTAPQAEIDSIIQNLRIAPEPASLRSEVRNKAENQSKPPLSAGQKREIMEFVHKLLAGDFLKGLPKDEQQRLLMLLGVIHGEKMKPRWKNEIETLIERIRKGRSSKQWEMSRLAQILTDHFMKENPWPTQKATGHVVIMKPPIFHDMDFVDQLFFSSESPLAKWEKRLIDMRYGIVHFLNPVSLAEIAKDQEIAEARGAAYSRIFTEIPNDVRAIENKAAGFHESYLKKLKKSESPSRSEARTMSPFVVESIVSPGHIQERDFSEAAREIFIGVRRLEVSGFMKAVSRRADDILRARSEIRWMPGKPLVDYET